MSSTAFDRKMVAYALAAPQLALAALFFYWPALQALIWSVHLERPFGGRSPFVGMASFLDLLGDDVFMRSLGVTAIFTAATTLLSFGGALALAVAASRRLKGSDTASALLLWPYAFAAPAAGVIAELVLDPKVGLAAMFNDWSPGLWSPATNGAQAMTMVIIAFAWLHTPFNFIFLLAGLRAAPQAPLEAAALDGAGAWRQLRDIRLPQLGPYVFFLLLLDVSESFTQSFGIINATTRGGPGGATNVLVYNIYADGFVGLDFSRASAESVLLILVMAAVTAAQFGWFRRRDRRS